MRKQYLLLVCFIFPLLLCGQPNSWINYSQSYYKIKVAKDGIYRIDSATLARAGIPSNIDARRFQLFFHGRLQYMYIHGDSVIRASKGDYIEFYGVHNSGALINDEASDSLLYTTVNPAPNSYITAVPNPYYSMFNDTSTYFLTWNGSLTNNRMSNQSIDTAFHLYTPTPYFTAEGILYGSNQYYAGARYDAGNGESVNDPRFTQAEGWFMSELDMGNNIQYSLPVSYVYQSAATPAFFKTVFLGESTYGVVDHHIKIFSSWGGLSPIADVTFGGSNPNSSFVLNTDTFTIPSSKLKAGNSSPTMTFSSYQVNGVPANITAVSYIYCQYPHTPNLGGAASFMMYLPPNSSGIKTYFDLTNLKNNGAGDSVRLYDLVSNSRYTVTKQGGAFKILLPYNGKNIHGYITSESNINKVTQLIPAGNNGTFTSYNVSGTSPAYIIIAHPSLMAEASAYSAYRSKKYPNQVLASVEELYDQFCYGIEKDPLAIRNFCNYVISKSSATNPPAALFIIGKGIHSNLFRQDTGLYNATLVPSFGCPSSDVLLTAGLNTANVSQPLQPAIPTGRLAAINNTQVINYLNKVRTYESNAPALWMKNIVHFAGGDASEQPAFLGYLQADAAIAEDTSLGAYVYTFQKTTTSPIQITLSDSVTNVINNGVSLMTFFGHASGNNFDINLDAPSNYNNIGKYPMILALACFSGDIFQPAGAGVSSVSEQFVLDPKGSIGFIAMDDIAESGPLANYANDLYTDFSRTMYRKPMGNCMQNVAGNIAGNGSFNMNDYMCLEMTLHGDPAIIINANDSLPDYAVNDSSVSFIPENVTAQMDSFKVKVTVYNLAKAVNQSVAIQIQRTLPGDDSVRTQTKIIKNIYNNGSVTFTFPVDKVNGIGMNYFDIKVDPSNFIHEITKSNNYLYKVPLSLSSGDIIPIYPYNFAIIPKDTATLKASTSNPFASAHNYIFQIDTTIYFNSPFLKSQYVNAKGGVVRASWKTWVNTPNMLPTFPNTLGPPSPFKFKDSTVYYWRARRDTSDMKDYGWQVSSFQYIRGKSGWGQSHYFQFDNNQYSFMEQQMKKRNWIFDSTGKTLTCQTYGNPDDSSLLAFETGYYFDYNIGSYGGCQFFPGLYMAVIDSTSLTQWSTLYHKLGNDNGAGSGCNYPFGMFIYWFTDPNAMQSMYTAIRDSVPNGDYILVWSWVEGYLHSGVPANLKNYLITNLGGSPAINTAPDTVPYIFFAKKGTPSTAKTLIGKNKRDRLTLRTDLRNHEYYGTMLTPLIGPAQKWDSISWRQHPWLKNAKDSVRLNVSAIDNNGSISSLLKGVTPAAANVYISSLNAKKYPYLQMSLYTQDIVTRTPSQMNKWQVFYTPVPEIAVNPSIYSSFYADSLYTGDTIKFKTVVQNVGDYPMDSMLVNSWVVDANNVPHYIVQSKRTKKLNPGDTTMISVKVANGYTGNSSIWLEANPPYLPQTRPEEYYFNNYAKKSFTTLTDKNNPLLDVTFDGVHILNNDIVSPHPNILVQVTSNDKYLPLDKNDTGHIAMYIRNINNPTPQRLYFTSPQIQFAPAVLPNNKCRILYTPLFTDGTYELSVQAADRSNNVSSANPYKIDFEVITESQITNVLNYPNPFSTSTRFVFTITGDQIPTYFKIQIITITGKVVREITESELGPLHIGRNITEYAWDGTDQFGSKLANGVYLYRVITSINNQSIDHLATNADSFFTKGWGKMYLIR